MNSVMTDSSPSNSSLEVTTRDKESSIAGPRSAIDDNPTPKPLQDHATAGLPKKIQMQNDEYVSTTSVVERLEAVKPSGTGFSETKDADVLSGRGGGTNLHPGNRYFRQLIVSHSNAYDKATKSKKPLVARDVVQQIRRRGGRFLRKDSKDGLFYEIGDDLAREKASQAFRHRTFELRKQNGPHHEKETAVPVSRKNNNVKRMRTTPSDQTADTGEDVTKRQKKDVIVAVAYPACNADCGDHSIDRMDKDNIEESSSAKGRSESFKLDEHGGVAVRTRRKEKEGEEGPTRTAAGRALNSMVTEPLPPPPPWPDVDTFPSFLYHSSAGLMPAPWLSGTTPGGQSSYRTMLPRRVTSGSGSLVGGCWETRYPTAMATRRSSTSSVSSSERSRSSRPNVVVRPEDLTQQRDEMRIPLDSLTTQPPILEGGVHATSHPPSSAVDGGTSRLVQSSFNLRTSRFQPQDSSSSGLRRLLPTSSNVTRFLPHGFQSPWSVLTPSSNQPLVLLRQPSSLAATASVVPLSTQSAAVEEYERSLLAEYVLLRRIQQERATLLGRLVHEHQEQQQQDEQSKEPQSYPRPPG